MENGESETERAEWEKVLMGGRGKEGCRLRTEAEVMAARKAKRGTSKIVPGVTHKYVDAKWVPV